MKMKRMILSGLLVGMLSTTAFPHVDLYGVYVRISQQSFFCAMISTKLCARVSSPDKDSPEYPWRSQFRCYNPDGSIADEFIAESYTLIDGPDGTTVEYVLP